MLQSSVFIYKGMRIFPCLCHNDIKDTLYSNPVLQSNQREESATIPYSKSYPTAYKFLMLKIIVRRIIVRREVFDLMVNQIKEGYLGCEIFEDIFISNTNKRSVLKRNFI